MMRIFFHSIAVARRGAPWHGLARQIKVSGVFDSKPFLRSRCDGVGRCAMMLLGS